MLQNTTSTKLQTLHQPHLQLEACLEKIHIKVVDFPNEKTANKMSENAPSIPKGHRHLPALGVLPLRHPNGSTHWIPPETLDATPFLPGGNACRIRDHCWCVCIYICKYANVYIYTLYSYALSCMLISKMQKHVICLGPFTDLHLAIFYPKINAPFVIHPWCHHAACC